MRIYGLVVPDSYNFEEELDPDPNQQSEKLVPDPH